MKANHNSFPFQIGENKAIAFTQPDEIEQELEDLPDDFYDLSVEEVRRLYSDLQKQRAQLENAPLMFASHNAEIQKEVGILYCTLLLVGTVGRTVRCIEPIDLCIMYTRNSILYKDTPLGVVG